MDQDNITALLIDGNICEQIDELTAENNQIWNSPDHDRREYVHSFFQYPAMMVPVVQKRIIEIIVSNKPETINVIDPFMGSGTSLVACMENGLNCFGQDINPLAVLVAKTRTGPYYFNAIKRKRKSLLEAIKQDKSVRIEAKFKGLNKWFKKEVAIELSKIVRSIRKEKRLAIRRFYWVILAETIRMTSNDRTSTFKLHIRTEEQILQREFSPIAYFKKHFDNCLEDIQGYAQLLKESDKLSKGTYTGQLNLSLTDSKSKIFAPRNKEHFYDLLVTSPPYGDNKTTITYGQHSYLPLQWIDLKDIDNEATIDYLRTTSEIDTRGLGGRIKKLNNINTELLFIASPTLREISRRLNIADDKKVNKVIVFFFDIFLSIKNIHNSLKKNSYQIWTVGNRTVAGLEIPNDKILTEFIEFNGSTLVKVITREILNRRMAKRNKSGLLMTYEDILIFRKVE